MEIKVPFYNILNMFLTGLVFIGGCLVIFPDTAVALFNSDIIENLGAGPEIVVTVCTFAVAYEVGLIINRTGSVVLEPLLKRTKLIPFNDNYTLFNQKKKEYSCEKVRIPDIKEQAAIAEVLSTADREIELLQQDIEQEKQKKKALMQLLLMGIVRVKI